MLRIWLGHMSCTRNDDRRAEGARENVGHHDDANAKNIAQEWANQAAAGQVTFEGNAGDGLTHLEEGTGNIYKLTVSEAQDRVNWLNRDVPVTKSDGTGFGVAQSFDGTYVYVAEYFFNK